MHVETTRWSPTAGWSDRLPQPDGRSTLVLVTGDPAVAHHAADPIGELTRTWHDHAIVGCASSGDDRSGLSVVVLRFDRTEVRASHHEIVRSGGVRRAGRRIATDLADPHLRGLFAVGPGAANPSAMLRGMADVLPDVEIAGATVDGWTVVDGRVAHGWMSAVALVGDHVTIGHGTGSGWEPYGTPHLVTSSWGDTIYAIDDRPATDVLRASRLDGAEQLRRRAMTRPLIVYDLDDHTVSRAVIEPDEYAGTLRCAGDVIQGGEIRLVHASADALVHGAHVAAKRAAFGHEQFAMICTSNHRRAVLGGRARDELRDVADVLDQHCRLMAVATVAEISPNKEGFDTVGSGGITVTTIGETLD